MCSSRTWVESGLSAALDALAADDLFGATDADLLTRTAVLVAARNRLDAELARAVQRADAAQAPERDGLTTMRSWLRSHTRLADGVARRLVDCGRAATQLPAVGQAFAGGAITAEQVAVIAPITSPADLVEAADAGVDVTAVGAALVDLATSAPHDRLRTAVEGYLARLDPDGAEPDPTERRSLTIARTIGGWHGSFDVDDLGGDEVATALESVAAASRCAGDDRTRARRLGDALVQLADLALAAGSLPVLRTQKPQVILTLSLDDLADPATVPGAARTGTGGLISAARARWAACDATITRIVLGPDGVPLDVGREHRIVPAHLRKAVVERDRTCVFAGCDAPHRWCEVHHVIEWINGGRTALHDSGLLCERHHGKVHHGFRIEYDLTAPPGRRWRTYRPEGTEILLGSPLAPAA